jgi:folate-dependent phosphoribosylglycinamide formyltransferase PurN
MSDQTSKIQLRSARYEEVGTVLNWLDDPALLAATNLQRMTTESITRARDALRAKIAEKLVWIAVRDNFRIGAVFAVPHDRNSGAAKTPSNQNSKSIFVYTKSRLDWALLSTDIAEVWRDETIGADWPIKVNRSSLSGNEPLLKNKSNDDLEQDFLEMAFNSEIRDAGSVKKIRILGPKGRNESIRKKLCDQGFEVIVSPEPYEDNLADEFSPDIILSSGYDRLLRPITVQRFSQRIINLHAAYLPWARGIGTTLFATMLRYPYGVSIHFINEGLDTGNLISRKLVQPGPKDTLRTLYSKLLSATEELFFESFPKIVHGQTDGVPQEQLGEINTNRSRLQFESLLDVCPNGYDTLISDLENFRDSLEASNAFRNTLLADPSVNL